MTWKWIVIVTVLIIVIVFTAQNFELVQIRFLAWSFKSSSAVTIFISLIVGFLIVILLPREALATECDEVYGGGETCIVNKSFEIEKKVRIEDEGSFKDKVSGVDEDDIIEFEITVTNKSKSDDGVDEDELTFDDMEMEDILPSELEWVSGDLTEDWDDFEKGEEKTFTIRARIDSDEFDRDGEWSKCVVNKAEVYFDGDFEGSDTATVCYGDEVITELPETGASIPSFRYFFRGLGQA